MRWDFTDSQKLLINYYYFLQGSILRTTKNKQTKNQNKQTKKNKTTTTTTKKKHKHKGDTG